MAGHTRCGRASLFRSRSPWRRSVPTGPVPSKPGIAAGLGTEQACTRPDCSIHAASDLSRRHCQRNESKSATSVKNKTAVNVTQGPEGPPGPDRRESLQMLSCLGSMTGTQGFEPRQAEPELPSTRYQQDSHSTPRIATRDRSGGYVGVLSRLAMAVHAGSGHKGSHIQIV